MKRKGKQKFGGDWTETKLEKIRKYLRAYSTIMNKKGFKFAYVDAFAGTGYRESKAKKGEDLFDNNEESSDFLDGSARLALNVQPEFHRYIFIEKNLVRFQELESLKKDFPDKADRIQLMNSDANGFLMDLCDKNWKHHRAVIFLDPFGMQVSWKTIEAIAKTEAIDLWILFPLGSGVSRLLRKDGQIEPSIRKKLDELFGDPTWYDTFYTENEDQDLFGSQKKLEKVADFGAIGRYFIKRLETIFSHVAKTPLPLLNSKNVPLFLLCFAAGNRGRGGKLAVKIAEDILGS